MGQGDLHEDAERPSYATVARRLAPPAENGVASTPRSGLPFTPESDSIDALSDVDRRQKELYSRQQQLLREQRSQDQQHLLNAIAGVLTPTSSCSAQGRYILAWL